MGRYDHSPISLVINTLQLYPASPSSSLNLTACIAQAISIINNSPYRDLSCVLIYLSKPVDVYTSCIVVCLANTLNTGAKIRLLSFLYSTIKLFRIDVVNLFLDVFESGERKLHCPSRHPHSPDVSLLCHGLRCIIGQTPSASNEFAYVNDLCEPVILKLDNFWKRQEIEVVVSLESSDSLSEQSIIPHPLSVTPLSITKLPRRIVPQLISHPRDDEEIPASSHKRTKVDKLSPSSPGQPLSQPLCQPLSQSLSQPLSHSFLESGKSSQSSDPFASLSYLKQHLLSLNQKSIILSLSSSQPDSSITSSLLSISVETMPEALTYLGLSDASLNDDVLSYLFSLSWIVDLTLAKVSIIIRLALFSRILVLSSSASRSLMTALSAFALHHPASLASHLLVPLFMSPTPSLGAPQAEVISRLLKESISASTGNGQYGDCLHITFLRGILDTGSNSALKNTPFEWNDTKISILISLLNLKPELSVDLLSSIIGACEIVADDLQSSLKFALFCFTFINKYGQKLGGGGNLISRMRMVVEKGQTFMSKQAVAALQRL